MSLDEDVALATPNPEEMVYTKFEPWMIGRLVELEVTEAVRASYHRNTDGVGRTLKTRDAGRLQSYGTTMANFPQGIVGWGKTRPVEYGEGAWHELAIRVVDFEHDPELAEARERAKLAMRASFLLGPGAARANPSQLSVGPMVSFSLVPPRPRRRRARIAGRMHE